MMSKKDILEYAKKQGYESALDLLLCLGKDEFDGTATEYNALMDDLMNSCRMYPVEANGFDRQ